MNLSTLSQTDPSPLHSPCRPDPCADGARTPVHGAPAIVVVLDSHRHIGDIDAVVKRARESGAPVIVYELATASLWTLPYDPTDTEEGFEARLLSEDQLRHCGHHSTAGIVSELRRGGVHAAAYLAASSWAGDLLDVLRHEQVGALVVAHDVGRRTARNIARALTKVALCPPARTA